jgi:hypothetical protein
MAANPLTDEGLEAYCRRRLLSLSWWQKGLIFDLDDAALGAWNGDRKREADERARNVRGGRPAPGETIEIPGDKQIPINDGKRLKSMLSSLARRRGRSD